VIAGREKRIADSVVAATFTLTTSLKRFCCVQSAVQAKSEFMSLMCHEVRTPLNGCLASAEMLLETPLKVRRLCTLY
jgi:signal transduction histidine kinase